MLLRDALNRLVSLSAVPQRMISLCPSVTETLYALGAGERVVGRTRFCIHPEPDVRAALRVGGTKSVDFERIASLNPDLIWCVKEENTPEMVATLEQRWPVYVFDVRTVEEGYAMIQTLGEITSCPPEPLIAEARRAVQEASALRSPLFTHHSPVHHSSLSRSSRSLLYLIWQNPWYAVGADTYIHDVLHTLGWENAAAALPGRYPEITPETLVALNPAQVLLSSEPFPFKEQHLREIQALLPDAIVQLCDGEAFSWYGARMRRLPEAVQKIRLQLP